MYRAYKVLRSLVDAVRRGQDRSGCLKQQAVKRLMALSRQDRKWLASCVGVPLDLDDRPLL